MTSSVHPQVSSACLREYSRTLADPNQFFLDLSVLTTWFASQTAALDNSPAPFYHWFSAGKPALCGTQLQPYSSVHSLRLRIS